MLELRKPNCGADRRAKKLATNKARRRFRETVLELDRNRCQNFLLIHDRYFKVDPHHIINRRPHNRDLDEPWNGITLCRHCHDIVDGQAPASDGSTAQQYMMAIIKSHKNDPDFRWGEALAELERKEGS